MTSQLRSGTVIFRGAFISNVLENDDLRGVVYFIPGFETCYIER
ncbi:hypothetical protein ABIE27_003862 [Paenibacillus sp. 4624]